MIFTALVLEVLARDFDELKLDLVSDHHLLFKGEVIDNAQPRSARVEPVGVMAQRLNRRDLDGVVFGDRVVGGIRAHRYFNTGSKGGA